MTNQQIDFSYAKYDFKDDIKYKHLTAKGIDEQTVRTISEIKNEPQWMLETRLKALKIFKSKPMPNWGADLSQINFDDIHYYASPTDEKFNAWDMVPEDIKKTFDKIGISEAERKFLGGASAQYDSEVVYHNLKKEWSEQGVVFLDMDTGLKEYPEVVRQYFGSVIPITDNKFAALNSAVWSGGSFVYVPENVHVKIPLQAYFRINTQNAGQFERTMIIAEPGSRINYVEGCSAPVYSAGALHSAVVEIVAKKEAYVRYTTIQNWSSNVYNLVTKRAVAHENSVVEWLDGNIGSRVTMKYPCIILKGKGARGEVLSVAFAGKGQNLDAGAKIIHQAPNTTSQIISKSISQAGGRSSYRGMLKVVKGATNCKAFVQCDAYLLDQASRSDTYPTIQIDEDTTTIGHEAKVGKIGSEKLFYLMSRGIPEKDALAMIVLGFIESFTKELPMEYAVELNRLIEVQLEGAVG
ncbi:Fe-S cluster assembly protein SufB [Candidatus Micrarchaeota archaeon]|nr:Fe-S cluster assembly protein SufB [Candidatus Micrarchaeota archaeon]